LTASESVLGILNIAHSFSDPLDRLGYFLTASREGFNTGNAMPKNYLKRSWINPKLRSGKSQIHGDGVFAGAKISAGEKLMEFGGEQITLKQALSSKYRERSVWMVAPDAYLALPVSDPHDSLDEHLNHSCDANIWLIDEVTVIAKRDIGAGEEITLDHATWNFDEANYADDSEACCCGATACRRMLTENDWRRGDVQTRYRGHFHPVIQKMIEWPQNSATETPPP
jgi:hypothetical protein